MSRASGPSTGSRISIATAAVVLFATGSTACHLMTAEPAVTDAQPDNDAGDAEPLPWLAGLLAARTCPAFSACCEDGWSEAQTAFCEGAWGHGWEIYLAASRENGNIIIDDQGLDGVCAAPPREGAARASNRQCSTSSCGAEGTCVPLERVGHRSVPDLPEG